MHTHRCLTCQQPFDCDGELFLNHDGEPRIACRIYHERGEHECVVCALGPTCAWCGLPGELIAQDGDAIHETCLSAARA